VKHLLSRKERKSQVGSKAAKKRITDLRCGELNTGLGQRVSFNEAEVDRVHFLKEIWKIVPPRKSGDVYRLRV